LLLRSPRISYRASSAQASDDRFAEPIVSPDLAQSLALDASAYQSDVSYQAAIKIDINFSLDFDFQ